MTCTDCDRRVYAKGVCQFHYNRRKKQRDKEYANGLVHVTLTGRRLVVPVPTPGWGYNTRAEA